MPWSTRRRLAGTITYAENSQRSIELPRANLLRALSLNFQGTLIIATAGTPVLKTGAAGSALRACTGLQVIANGRDTIKNINPTALAMKNLYLSGTLPRLVETGITAATHPYGGVVQLPFAMPRSVRPLDTLLPSMKLSTLELRASFGSGASMFSTQPTTITSNALNILVHLLEEIRLDGKDENYAQYKENYLEKTVTAAGTLQIVLPVGNRYRGLLIEAESDGNMVNTVFTGNAELKSGTDVFVLESAASIQGDNIVRHNLSAAVVTGYYYLDLTPDGQLVNGLDATVLSSLELNLGVAAPGTVNTIRVYPDEIVAASK